MKKLQKKRWVKNMPEICRFLGIIIMINYNDHAPPHFHAKYAGYEITVDIKTRVITGKFPPRALKLVLEWAEYQEARLLEDWERAKNRLPLLKIEPLE
jgi:hypothetical protein